MTFFIFRVIVQTQQKHQWMTEWEASRIYFRILHQTSDVHGEYENLTLNQDMPAHFD